MGGKYLGYANIQGTTPPPLGGGNSEAIAKSSGVCLNPPIYQSSAVKQIYRSANTN